MADLLDGWNPIMPRMAGARCRRTGHVEVGLRLIGLLEVLVEEDLHPLPEGDAVVLVAPAVGLVRIDDELDIRIVLLDRVTT